MQIPPNINPQNLMWYDAVQIFALFGLFGLTLWNTLQLIEQGKTIIYLKTVIGNHFKHRFQKIKDVVGVEWDDNEDDISL